MARLISQERFDEINARIEQISKETAIRYEEIGRIDGIIVFEEHFDTIEEGVEFDRIANLCGYEDVHSCGD